MTSRLSRQLVSLLGVVLGIGLAGAASASTVTMDFDALGGAESVSEYYNGGCSKGILFLPGTCGGPDYGVSWGPNAFIRGESFTANLANEPSAPNIMTTHHTTMNVAGGFTALSFFYAFADFAAGGQGNVSVFSGLDGSGTLLATMMLPATGVFGDGCLWWQCWNQVDLGFLGTARSAIFNGDPNSLTDYGFDNVTLAFSVPEPASLGIFGLGLLLAATFLGLRRRSVDVEPSMSHV